MAKKKIYWYKLRDNTDVIKELGSGYTKQTGSVLITKAEYDNYKSILASIPNKDGYTKKVTLHVDGTYEVEYIEIVPDEDEETEE